MIMANIFQQQIAGHGNVTGNDKNFKARIIEPETPYILPTAKRVLTYNGLKIREIELATATQEKVKRGEKGILKTVLAGTIAMGCLAALGALSQLVSPDTLAPAMQAISPTVEKIIDGAMLISFVTGMINALPIGERK